MSHGTTRPPARVVTRGRAPRVRTGRGAREDRCALRSVAVVVVAAGASAAELEGNRRRLAGLLAAASGEQREGERDEGKCLSSGHRDPA